MKSTADSVAGKAQPEGEKSTFQSATDSVTGGSSDASKSASDTAGKAQEQGSGVLNQASESLGNAATQAQNALGLGESAYGSNCASLKSADCYCREVKATQKIPNA